MSTQQTPADTIKSEVYIPKSMPPYEKPLDLRYPLHFDHTAIYKSHNIIYKNKALEQALKAAQADIGQYGVCLYIMTASKMSHYPGGISPPFFEVDLDPSEVRPAFWQEIHEKVPEIIEKYFGQGQFEEEWLQRPIMRYTAKERDDIDDSRLLFD